MENAEKVVRPGTANGRGNTFPDEHSEGLSRREYFAGLALQGILAKSDYDNDFATAAVCAVKMADALLEALETRG